MGNDQGHGVRAIFIRQRWDFDRSLISDDTLVSSLIPGSARYAFRSLSIPSYRRYFCGQSVSAIGSWMQSIALSWLVYELSGSGSALGLTIMLQFLPMLLLGPMAGVWAERRNKRRLLILTQGVLLAEAALMGALTLAGVIDLWMVYGLAVVYGLAMAVNNPTGNVFVFEMVEPEYLSNAVSLNLIIFNIARIAGPALAGAAISVIGIGPCFLLNAASFVPVIVVLLLLRPEDLREMPRQPRAPRQVREALGYIRRRPDLLGSIVMLAVFGAFAWEFEVSIPLLARQTFDGGAGLFGLLTAAIGVGAIVGGVFAAHRPYPTNRVQLASAALAGTAMLAAGSAPSLWMAFVALAFAGAGITAWYGVLTALFQLNTARELQGRSMALWATSLNGARPIGAPIVGLAGELFGARAPLLLGGAAIFAVCIPVWARLSHHPVIATLCGRGEPPPASNEGWSDTARSASS